MTGRALVARHANRPRRQAVIGVTVVDSMQALAALLFWTASLSMEVFAVLVQAGFCYELALQARKIECRDK